MNHPLWLAQVRRNMGYEIEAQSILNLYWETVQNRQVHNAAKWYAGSFAIRDYGRKSTAHTIFMQEN